MNKEEFKSKIKRIAFKHVDAAFKKAPDKTDFYDILEIASIENEEIRDFKDLHHADNLFTIISFIEREHVKEVLEDIEFDIYEDNTPNDRKYAVLMLIVYELYLVTRKEVNNRIGGDDE